MLSRQSGAENLAGAGCMQSARPAGPAEYSAGNCEVEGVAMDKEVLAQVEHIACFERLWPLQLAQLD